MNFNNKLFLFICLFLSFFIEAQTLSSKLEKKTLVLGEPNTFTVTIQSLAGKNVVASAKNELLPFHFEELKDETKADENTYTRTIEFQVFEEGKFNIPELEFKVGEQILKTIPYEIEVINTAQKGDQIHDIMKNKEVKLGVKDYYNLYKFYILAALAIFLLAFLLYRMFKSGVFKKSLKKEKSSTNKTLQQLDVLKKKGYIEKGDYRSFYVELIEISREFLMHQYHIPADVLLTDDLIILMKKFNRISPENEKVVEEIFLRGDMVKFAKVFPDKNTMEKDFNEMRALVQRSHKDIEAEELRSLHAEKPQP